MEAGLIFPGLGQEQRWFEENRDFLNVGNVSVSSESASLVSPGLISAIWLCWCTKGRDLKGYNPSVESMTTLAAHMNNAKDSSSEI